MNLGIGERKRSRDLVKEKTNITRVSLKTLENPESTFFQNNNYYTSRVFNFCIPSLLRFEIHIIHHFTPSSHHPQGRLKNRLKNRSPEIG